MENKVPMINTARVVAGAILTFNYRCLGISDAWICPRGQGIKSVCMCASVSVFVHTCSPVREEKVMGIMGGQ